MKNRDKELSKKTAAEKAAGYVKDGMVVGLGTGSTVKYFIDKLASRIKEESLDVTGIPTSNATEKQAKELGITLTTLNECATIDLDVDGADEVDPEFNLIKGGGGAHTREKIVASASKNFIVIVDSEKMVQRLGSFPVPVEALPCAQAFAAREIGALGGLARRREGFVTDNGNIILDSRFNIINPAKLEMMLNAIPGVVENGIFAARRPETVLCADGRSVKVMERE